jgi:hypothetical protein
MLQAEHSIRRIAQVREAAEDVGSAYLLRTRLHRMLLSIQRGLAVDLGVSVKAPCLLEVMPDVNETSRRIIELCNSIMIESKHLSQRSESLDARWQDNWRALRTKLDLLEEELRSASALETRPEARVSGGDKAIDSP